MELTFRRAVSGDASALSELAQRAKAHWGYSDELLALWRDDLTLTARYIEEHTVHVAVESDCRLGVYALGGAGAECELDHFWVEPEHMGRGIGRHLLEHACNSARASGASHLKIASDPYAEAFYVHMGARKIGMVAARPRGRELPLLLLAL